MHQGKNTPPGGSSTPSVDITSCRLPFHLLTKRERSFDVAPVVWGRTEISEGVKMRIRLLGFKKVRPSSYGISCLSSFTFVHVQLANSADLTTKGG